MKQKGQVSVVSLLKQLGTGLICFSFSVELCEQKSLKIYKHGNIIIIKKIQHKGKEQKSISR